MLYKYNCPTSGDIYMAARLVPLRCLIIFGEGTEIAFRRTEGCNRAVCNVPKF
jgi:hypothetical protein